MNKFAQCAWIGLLLRTFIINDFRRYWKISPRLPEECGSHRPADYSNEFFPVQKRPFRAQICDLVNFGKSVSGDQMHAGFVDRLTIGSKFFQCKNSHFGGQICNLARFWKIGLGRPEVPDTGHPTPRAFRPSSRNLTDGYDGLFFYRWFISLKIFRVCFFN